MKAPGLRFRVSGSVSSRKYLKFFIPSSSINIIIISINDASHGKRVPQMPKTKQSAQ